MLMELTYDELTNTATWRFPGLPGGTLPGSMYVATLEGASILDASGNHLDGDGDLQPGGDFVLGFQQSRNGGSQAVPSDKFMSLSRTGRSGHAVRDVVFARLFAPGVAGRGSMAVPSSRASIGTGEANWPWRFWIDGDSGDVPCLSGRVSE